MTSEPRVTWRRRRARQERRAEAQARLAALERTRREVEPLNLEPFMRDYLAAYGLDVAPEPRCAQPLVTRLVLVASLLALGAAVWVVVR
jgi:hypothetical protein